MKAYGITHRGAVRTENQDTLRYQLPEGRELLTAVLCDGMGGAQGGSIASGMAADTFMSHAANSLDETSSAADMRAILQDAVKFANDKVYDRAFSDFSCMGMGSTLVAALISGKRALVANVGDSRAYYIFKDQMQQVTCDHSLVEDMVARGKITREEARRHPKKNIITRAVGVEASVRTDIFDVKFPPGSTLLLCSDGLTNTVTDSEILEIVKNSGELQEACDRLLRLALDRGAPDNVTVLLAQH